MPVYPANPGTMKLFLLSLLLFGLAPSQAQYRCSTIAKTLSGAGSSVQTPPALNTHFNTIAGITDAAANKTIRIPVVVHVVYQTATQNISDAQVQSGIDALNRDFRRRNEDSVFTPARFRQLAADMEIEFVLATADPLGRATKGIVRKQTMVKSWRADDQIKFSAKGGDDAWDASSYLNIWVGNIPRMMGYASSPGCHPQVDGIVINTSSYGTLGKSGAYNMGRTLVHETGHWLGLKHIWGDSDCGDDGIADTPKQAGFTSGCPNGFISTCGNGNMGDMYMNFMDFTNDACMNLFTKGQKEKARACFEPGQTRYAMMASRGLSAPWNNSVDVAITGAEEQQTKTAVRAIQVYPNPAADNIILAGTETIRVGATVQVISVNGDVELHAKIKSLPYRISLESLKPGIYLLKVFDGTTAYTTRFIRTSMQ